MFIPVQDDNPLRSIRFQWVTVLLIAVNAICFLLESTDRGQTLAASFAIVPAELFKVGLFCGSAMGPNDVLAVPESATLLSYMFLHGDILHLISNMLFLWVFGDNVEDAMGHARYLLFYLACGVFAALVHAWAMPQSQLPLIGASGAVAGIVAAYLLLYPNVRVWVLFLRFIPLNITAAVALGSWILAQLAMILIRDQSQTAWWAHVGGLVAGAILVLLLRRPGVALFGR